MGAVGLALVTEGAELCRVVGALVIVLCGAVPSAGQMEVHVCSSACVLTSTHAHRVLPAEWAGGCFPASTPLVTSEGLIPTTWEYKQLGLLL